MMAFTDWGIRTERLKNLFMTTNIYRKCQGNNINPGLSDSKAQE